jgi:flagellar hook-associated protein 1 FlgK
MSGLLGIGSSAMNAAYAQLQTTGQNIANASTPGYVRREVVLREAGDMGPAGWVGRGVDVQSVRRVYDQFLTREASANRAAAAQDTARSDALGRLEQLFADSSTGLGAGFDDLVSAFGDVAARPADPSARATVLARAETFADRARTLDARLVELRDGAQGRMQGEVDKANGTLAALARVNERIASSQGALADPNGLLDQRDRLLADLNSVLRANATIGSDGAVTVTSPRGEPLVVAGRASRLELAADPLDPSRLGVSVVRGDGTRLPLSPAETGGTLAGLMRFVSEDVEAARAQLGRMTASVAGRFNALQASGLDADGNAGRPLFALGTPKSSGASDNAGNAAFGVSMTDPAALKASDYELAFDGTGYTLTRLSDGVARTFGALPQQVDGLSLSLDSGAAAAGDRYLIRSATAFAAGARALQTNPARIAAAMPVAAETGAANGGDLKVNALSVSSIGPATGAAVTFTFTGPNTFDVTGAGTGNPTGLTYTPGTTLSFNGWSLSLGGTPAAGDTVRVVPTANPASDNRNARAMQALGDERFVDGASLVDRYAELVGDVGARSQGAQASADMSRRLYDDAEKARTAASGVNLDEEAARLMQYQQAYQAAAKVIATANEMFRTLLDAAG